MIHLGEWLRLTGFKMQNSEMVICSRIHSAQNGRNWAILRRFELGPKILSPWNVIGTYRSLERAQERLSAVEEGMWREGFETTPIGPPASPYDDVEGFGAF
ncbi:hypothetical protein PXK56_18370 [Phaeobacter gallaeciensis]|uniref:hypothetical protein n=1 Tax=Phaeobacter gallaeciensis TaxID=60890 RepID=UPI002380B169|nr:hypothetical protein [Phaeobacter gallaeciensis]MDE4297153.1 hypothetical protein [Phaeobacter gallaeciensis]